MLCACNIYDHIGLSDIVTTAGKTFQLPVDRHSVLMAPWIPIHVNIGKGGGIYFHTDMIL